MYKVFVYGTLKHGYGNHRLLQTATFLGVAASIADNYALYCNGSYPCLKEGNGPVYGELYEVDDHTLKALDWLEGVDSGLYKRTQISVSVEDAYITTAYVYIYNHDVDGYTKVDSGEWNGPEPKAETGYYGNCL